MTENMPLQKFKRPKIMGDIFRSEEMVSCQLFIQPEAAYQTISELGETGVVQFRDLNHDVNSFQRKYASEVKRCNELERQLRYIESEMIKDEIKIPLLDEIPRAPLPREIINLEAHLERNEQEILELSTNATNLKATFQGLTEMKHVLEKSVVFLDDEDNSKTRESVSRHFDEDVVMSRARLGFVAGVIERERVPGFERMLWRISRGNVFLRQAPLDEPLEDPKTGNEMYKTVFVAFFQGEQLKNRLLRVCSGYRASIYPVPNKQDERTKLVQDLDVRLADLTTVLNQTKDHRARVLVNVSKEFHTWSIMVRKMKAIYHTLNMFNDDVTKKCLIGECWTPTKDIPVIEFALKVGTEASGSPIGSFINIVNSAEVPPTYNRTNKFTQGFQNLIDSYGVASYREVNPALYTIITFPFLFAVMFGDAGHGIVVAAFGGFLVLREKQLAKLQLGEIWDIFFGGRYIIFLMGLFSIFTGVLYNDFFSKSVNIFGSKWTNPYDWEYINATIDKSDMFNPRDSYSGTPYPFGVDPIWQIATNKIIFLNSYKMKLSVIIAVFHMLFGVCLGVVNFIHFKHYSHILVETVPHILFLSSLIFYMVFMMFFKWDHYSAMNDLNKNSIDSDFIHSSTCAPSILIMFINMMLFKESDIPLGCEKFMYSGQNTLQMILVLVALLCVPVMLAGKPMLIMLERRRQEPDDKLEEMKEIWIKQIIHTIEYCLNTISHTASYLRLWALSLAHAQLSDVVWNMIFSMGLKSNSKWGSIGVYIFFACWAMASLGILIIIEGLSAFLHTLRLHWVEFMTKFYEGMGTPFQPFAFKTILNSDEIPTEDDS